MDQSQSSTPINQAVFTAPMYSTLTNPQAVFQVPAANIIGFAPNTNNLLIGPSLPQQQAAASAGQGGLLIGQNLYNQAATQDGSNMSYCLGLNIQYQTPQQAVCSPMLAPMCPHVQAHTCPCGNPLPYMYQAANMLAAPHGMVQSHGLLGQNFVAPTPYLPLATSGFGLQPLASTVGLEQPEITETLTSLPPSPEISANIRNLASPLVLQSASTTSSASFDPETSLTSDNEQRARGAESLSQQSPATHKKKKGKKESEIPPDLQAIIQQTLNEVKKKTSPASAVSTHKHEQTRAPNTPASTVRPPPVSSTIINITQTKLKKDEIIVVAVSDVESPWSFHIQLTDLLPDIRRDIESAVASGQLTNIKPQAGLFCLSKYSDGQFYRARIEDYIEERDYPARIQVRYIDYGNKQWVSVSDLLNMSEDVARPPAQAVLCALAKVKPLNSDFWSEQATRHLRQLTTDTTVQMRVVHLGSSGAGKSHPSSPTSHGDGALSPGGRSSKAMQSRPHLVNIVVREGTGGKATALSASLIKGGHAQFVDVMEQVEMIEANAANRTASDKTLQGLQQLMQNLKTSSRGADPATDRLHQILMGAASSVGANVVVASPRGAGAESDGGSSALCAKKDCLVVGDGVDKVSPSTASSHRKALPLCLQRMKKLKPPKVGSARLPPGVGNGQIQEFGATPVKSEVDHRLSDADGRRPSLYVGANVKPEIDSVSVVNGSGDASLHLSNWVDNVDTCDVYSPPTTEINLALSLEVDKKLRSLGHAAGALKSQGLSGLHLDDSEREECSDNLNTGELSGGGTHPAVVVSVISPSSFFLHRVDERCGRDLEDLSQGINQEFRSLTRETLKSLSENFICERHRLCCAVFSQDGCFYRGLVLDVSEDQETSVNRVSSVLVLFIDFGDFEWVERGQVYPLPSSYRKITPIALWCCLEGVQPVADASTSSSKDRWPVATIKQFLSLVKGNKKLAFVPSNADYKIERIQGFQLEPMPIYLVDQSGENWSGDEQGGLEICINLELIDQGLASVSGQQGELGQEAEEKTDENCDSLLEDWDPMESEFHSARNSYNVDTDNPGVALVGYESGKVGRDGRKVCVFYNRPGGCYKRDNCPNLHIKGLKQDGLSHDQVCVNVFDEDQTSVLPSKGGNVVVTVSAVISPSKFYITLPWGPLPLEQVGLEVRQRYFDQETLEGMMDNMQEFYASRPFDGDLTVLAQGQAMAARVKGQWVRAKVTDTAVENFKVEVLAVDFGWQAWVKETDLRNIEPRFLHLPPQAVECGLAGVVSSDGEGWADHACALFAELVSEKPLVAHVKQRYAAGRLGVVLYDTVSGGQDLNVNKALVKTGHAVEDSQSHKSLNTQDDQIVSHSVMNFAPA